MSSTATAHDFFLSLDVYALWLMPSEGDAPLLQDIIHMFVNDQSKKMWFEAHMTAQALPSHNDPDEIIGILNEGRVFQTTEPLDGEIMGVGTSEYFTQALFLPVRPSRPLMDLSTKIRGSFGIDDDPFMPHLSAAYGGFSSEERGGMMRKLTTTLSFTWTITFDRVALVYAKGFPNEWKEVYSWGLVT